MNKQKLRDFLERNEISKIEFILWCAVLTMAVLWLLGVLCRTIGM